MVLIGATAGIAWAVSPIIDVVKEKIESYIGKYFEHAGTGEHFKEMKKSLGEIRLIMATVEKQRIEKPLEVQLVLEIKDAVYEAEDVVKESEYKLLDEEKFLEQHKLESEGITTQPSKKQKLDSAASSSSFVHAVKSACHTLKEKGKELSENLDWPILGDGEFKKKVKEVSENLVRAKASAEILLKLMNTNTSAKIQSADQENESDTSSQICEEIIGRIEECEKIIELLFEKNKETPTIIQIEGPGGIGKTTLARLVYNDPRVTESKEQDSFELKMWLSVSENFDSVKLTKEMLQYVSPNFSQSVTSFDLLQKELKEKLASKRILLILDNVWYVKDVNKKSSFEQNWLQILAPLKKTKPGSKIIVTTREGAVDTTFESFGSLEVMKLGGLNDADSWSLLKLKAFGRKNQHNRHDLEPIGEELVKNLEGFPLAIRVVGTELRGESKKEEWERILNDNALDKCDIMGILLRSYEHLPDYLQPCFAYCSLFPKGYYLKPDRLVHMWIAQGFVHPREKKSSEEIGNYYFNELIDRSFIQVIKGGNKEYFIMHDLMNDLACHVSQGECYIFKEGDTLENLGSVRHLSVTATELDHLVSIRGLDKLRTLILLCSTYRKVNVVDEVFIQMKRIRVLDIDCCLGKFPNIGECKLLHYLCFRHCGHYKRKLAPNTFRKFHLLIVLFIRKSHHKINILYVDLKVRLKLPQSICSMSRLEFIDTSKSIPIDIGGHDVHLSSLWRGGYASFTVKKKEGWELGHLGYFNNIKDSLEIRGLENAASREEAIQAQLGSKEHVTQLKLMWSSKSIVESNIEHDEIHESLRPHRSIKRMEIYNYPVDKFFSWLEPNWLSIMTYIEIRGKHSGFKMLPTLGQFSQLKIVKIKFIATVSRIGDEFYGNGIFPSLKVLQIRFMDGLEEWSSPRGVHSFSKLHRLDIEWCRNLFSLPEMESFCLLKSVYIMNCPKIRSLPKLPVSLQHLKVEGLHNLRQFYCNDIFSSLEQLHIKGMKGLEEWSSPNGVHSFPKLHTLWLHNCPNLFALPELESFPLKYVEIVKCPKIRSLPKLPVSLQNLKIEGLILHDLKQFYGNDIFPSLEQLHIKVMEDLEEWSSPCGVHLFPKLRTLWLHDCPNMSSLPELESFCSLEYVEIKECPKIRSLPKLPVSLQYLDVDGLHPDLEEQFEKKNGLEWDKIAAVSGCRSSIYRDGTWVVFHEGE